MWLQFHIFDDNGRGLVRGRVCAHTLQTDWLLVLALLLWRELDVGRGEAPVVMVVNEQSKYPTGMADVSEVKPPVHMYSTHTSLACTAHTHH